MQLAGKSCAVVLIGTKTADRKWIKYEIEKAWRDGKGVVGVHVHNLKDKNGKQSSKGISPFTKVTDRASGKKLSLIVKAYDPPYSTSPYVYTYIETCLAGWVEKAITIRKNAR